MLREEIKHAVIRAAVETGGKKRLSCADALRLAAEHGIAPQEIGRICDQENIKLQSCQLGCF
ncbi:MAG: hypothetical protein V2A66_07045 [Pseudomonadota bacterium]